MNRQSQIFTKMITRIKDLLAPPIFEEEEKTRIARILGIILWSIVAVVGTLIVIWLATDKSYELGPCAILANSVIVAVSIGLLFLIRSGHVKQAGLIFIIFLWVNITFQAYTSDGVRGSAAIIYITILVLAGLLVSWKSSIAFAALSTICIWLLAHAEVIGLTTFQTPGPYEVALEASAMFVLAALGYDVVTRTSSEEALELFKSQPNSFDLVITDMTMPTMTGDKLAREMMNIRSDLPVILCTGFSARMSETTALDLGIRAYVTKPALIRQIAETIRKVLDEGSD